MISKPGLYLNIPTAEYFADPAPMPSLTQSIAKILLDRSPLHAWHAHPKLNPDFKPDNDRKFDVGNIAHQMMTGRGKEIVVLPEKVQDWRTNAAKEAREEAAKQGKLAVLGKHFKLAGSMVAAAREQFELRGESDLFTVGDGEVVCIWNEGAVWFRQMIDWLSRDRLTFIDYKTTDESAAPHAVARKMANDGWHIQAAMAERGLNAIGMNPGQPRRYLFVVQETQVPYCLTVVEINEQSLTMGRKMLDVAARIWRECVALDRWPGYPLKTVVPEFPPYAEASWLDREQTEFVNVLMAG